MRIHKITIVPAAGWLGSADGYSRGHCVGNIAEIDVVDKYIRAIADQFDDAGIRHDIMGTRRAPGIALAARSAGILPQTLVLHCTVGWVATAGRLKANKSSTFFGPATPYDNDVMKLAKLIAEAQGHWGSLYVAHEHQNANPVIDDKDPLINVAGSYGVRIEPFILNGPQAQLYCGKLEEIGRDIGRTIADYFIAVSRSSRPSSSA